MVRPRRVEQFVGGTARDGHGANRSFTLANDRQPLEGQEALQPPAKLGQRDRLGKPTASARPLTFGMRRQRCHAAQTESRGQAIVNALRRPNRKPYAGCTQQLAPR